MYVFAVHRGPRLGDCVDNCTISATDVTWVWKHLTQGFFCQLFCVCRTQRTKDLNLLLFSTRLAKAHRFKVCLKHKVRSNLFFIICFIKYEFWVEKLSKICISTKGTDLQCWPSGCIVIGWKICRRIKFQLCYCQKAGSLYCPTSLDTKLLYHAINWSLR